MSQACYIVEIYPSGPEPSIQNRGKDLDWYVSSMLYRRDIPFWSRTLHTEQGGKTWTGMSQACYIVEIYPSGPEPSIQNRGERPGLVCLKHVI